MYDYFDINALIVNFPLARKDVFFYGRIVIVQVLSYAIMYKSCGASNVEFFTSLACDLIHNFLRSHRLVYFALGHVRSVVWR